MALVVFIIMTFSVLSVQMFAGAAEVIDDEITCPGNYSVWSSPEKSFKTYDDNGTVLGYTYYKVYMFRNRNYKIKGKSTKVWNDTIVVRATTEPRKSGKIIYGVSEYLKVCIVLPTTEVNAWSPSNGPHEENWTIGFNAGADSSKNISVGLSASTTVAIKNLSFTDDVRKSEKRAYFMYDYKPFRTLAAKHNKNKYVANAKNQYCMVNITTNGTYAYRSLTVALRSHYARVNAGPSMYFGAIQKGSFSSGNKKYTWKIFDSKGNRTSDTTYQRVY